MDTIQYNIQIVPSLNVEAYSDPVFNFVSCFVDETLLNNIEPSCNVKFDNTNHTYNLQCKTYNVKKQLTRTMQFTM